MTNPRLTYPHRSRGLDHDLFPHQQMHLRAPIVWPDNKPIALWLTIPVEFFPLDASSEPFRPLGALTLNYPDLWNYSARDYGLRIGIYRIMRVLDGLGLRATVAMNSAIAARCPRLVSELSHRAWEFVAHGVDMGHLHHGGLALDDERSLIRTTHATLARETRMPVSGWLSPDRSQSSNTLTLLAEAGFRYVTDWANDDMPYMVATKAGPLCALPLTYELSDRLLLLQNNLDVGEYVDQVLRAFAHLNAEFDRFDSGRILSLSITPWILGYPHRIGALERLLGHLLESGLVWNANGTEIVDTFEAQSTGVA